MKVQLLTSTIDENGTASQRQHLLTMIIDDSVAIDAGCLALSCTDLHRQQLRNIVLTHTHLDHIAGLPLFLDDLFATLKEPVCIHATAEQINIIERDLFNWAIYPRFSELSNDNGPVIRYQEFERGATFTVRHLTVKSVPVNHKVSANGFIVSDERVSIAITGDTKESDAIWDACNEVPNLRAAFVECAFPNELGDLASVSDHLTPERVKIEVEKIKDRDFPVFVINIKPMYRDRVIGQLKETAIPNLEILELGKVYEF